GAIADRDMAAKNGAVGHDHVVAKPAIVRDVRGAHEEAVVADDGLLTFDHRAMDADVFADGVAGTDAHARGGFFVEADRLRRQADRCACVDAVVGADFGQALDVHRRPDARAVADPDGGFNDGARTDFNVLAEFGSGIDNGGGMNPEWGHDALQTFSGALFDDPALLV